MQEKIKVDNEMQELENKGSDNIDQPVQATKGETKLKSWTWLARRLII